MSRIDPENLGLEPEELPVTPENEDEIVRSILREERMQEFNDRNREALMRERLGYEDY